MGTIVIIFLLLITLIVVGVFMFAVSNTNKYGIEYQVSKKLIKENNPKIGDDVKFWLNPQNNNINIYFKGSVGGAGKIGEINSNPDRKKLENNELYAKICNITETSIFIKFY